MKKYKIRNLCTLLDGLVVDAEFNDSLNLYSVVRIEQKNHLMASFSNPVFEESFFISPKHLVEYQDEDVEFDTTSPYGKFISSKCVIYKNLIVTLNKFERAVSVKVQEESTKRTLYSHSFFSKTRDVLKLISLVEDEVYETDDLIFDLQEYQ